MSLSKSVYSADYFDFEGRPSLPIRWMSWESILLVRENVKYIRIYRYFCNLTRFWSVNIRRPYVTVQNKYTPRSDVWSFAVTLWEILTFAREQPYEELSDQHVIDNVTRLYQNDGNFVSIYDFIIFFFFLYIIYFLASFQSWRCHLTWFWIFSVYLRDLSVYKYSITYNYTSNILILSHNPSSIKSLRQHGFWEQTSPRPIKKMKCFASTNRVKKSVVDETENQYQYFNR